MEAATLRPARRSKAARPSRRSFREWARERSRAFWIVVGLTVLAAALRFATLGVQSYHHDEVVTASRILRAGFGHAMHAGLDRGVDAAGLLRARLGLDAAGRDRGIRPALDLGGGRGGDGAGRLPDRGRAARPARRPLGGGAGRGQPDDALVLAGGAGLRAGRALRRALGALLAAGRTHRRAARLRLVGDLVGPRDRHPLLRRLPDPRRGADAAAPARAADEPRRDGDPRRLRDRGGAGGDPPDVARPRRLDRQLHASATGSCETAATFVTGETGDIIARPERPWLAFVPLALALAALALAAAARARRGSAAPPPGRSSWSPPGSASRSRWRCSRRARTSSSPAT